jgi:hypothetical protein
VDFEQKVCGVFSPVHTFNDHAVVFTVNAQHMRPCLPLLSPVVTTTRSPFFIFNLLNMVVYLLLVQLFIRLLQERRNNFHIVFLAEFAGNRAENTCTTNSPAVEQNHCVVVETDITTICTTNFFFGANDYRFETVPFFTLPAWKGILHCHHYLVAKRSISSAGTTQYTDNENFASRRCCLQLSVVIRSVSFFYLFVDPRIRLKLFFLCSPNFQSACKHYGSYPRRLISPFSTLQPSLQRFNLLSGRVSMIRTLSPTPHSFLVMSHEFLGVLHELTIFRVHEFWFQRSPR